MILGSDVPIFIVKITIILLKLTVPSTVIERQHQGKSLHNQRKTIERAADDSRHFHVHPANAILAR